MNEHHKALVRLSLFPLLTIIIPAIVGVRITAIWVTYVLVAVLYALWACRLSSSYRHDARLAYLLCITDMALLLPSVVWSSGLWPRIIILMIWAAGLAATYLAGRRQGSFGADKPVSIGPPAEGRGISARPPGLETVLDRAVRIRMSLFAQTGARFGLVILRIVRYEEAATYYGPRTATRMVSAVGRRGLRHLGHDAQLFALGDGRVAFLFETEPLRQPSGVGSPEWNDAREVEGMAMKLARKTCGRLIEGHRVQCVVGWASVPADGINAEDLVYAAESGTRSAETFRRVAPGLPGEARTAVG